MKFDKIVVVGGGSAGWMTAATLIRAFPEKDISVIESPDVPTVGVGESTLGKIRQWTRYLGIDDKDFIPFTDATYKLSIRFTNFKTKDSGSFHYPFGTPVLPNSDPATAIKNWHLVNEHFPEVNDMTSYLHSASSLWENHKFDDNCQNKFDNFYLLNDSAYHFDASRFGLWLRDRYCLPRGVKWIPKHVESIDTDHHGIKELVMSDGERISADLFVDCTGFRSLLLGGALSEPFVSYSDILPNDSAWATQIPYEDKYKELTSYTDCTAIENGWVWNIPLWSRIGTGYVYSSKYVSDEQALEEFKNHLCNAEVPRTREQVDSYAYKKLNMRVGIHERLFVKNVVAIGLSAGFIEPLESNGLLSVHEFLLILIDIMQRDHITSLDKKWFNTECRDFFDGFAKFVAMHYAMSQRDDTVYWQDNMERNYPETRNGPEYDSYDTRINPIFHAQRMLFDGPFRLFGIDGMTYISVGMGYRTFAGKRLAGYEHMYGNSRPQAESLKAAMIDQKSRWNREAESCLHVVDYMKKHFYPE